MYAVNFYKHFIETTLITFLKWIIYNNTKDTKLNKPKQLKHKTNFLYLVKCNATQLQQLLYPSPFQYTAQLRKTGKAMTLRN